MGILARSLIRELASSASLGALLFIFVLFLQKASQLFSILVNSTAQPATVGYLFLLILPSTMPLTLPLGALVGTLIALSRMSGDGEVTAMRAAGVPARRLTIPVVCFATLAMALTGACSLWLTPWCNAEAVRIVNQIGAAQLTAEIQPRVFDESFPDTALYVGDVIPGTPVRWRNVFMMDLSASGQGSPGALMQKGEGPRVTISSEAVVRVDKENNRLQLMMKRMSSYEAAQDPKDYYRMSYPEGDQVLEASPRAERKAKLFSATPTLELIPEAAGSLEARIELHQRLALPLACVLLALTGMPLGVSSRKGGKSGAFVITVLFAFLYYMALVTLVSLSREGRIPAEWAVWLPNAGFAIAAVILLIRLERPGDRGPAFLAAGWVRFHWDRLRGYFSKKGGRPPGLPGGLTRARFFLLPQVVDLYVVSSFLFYFTLMLISFVMLTEIFNFFELLGDTFRNNIAIGELLRYLFFLAPKLIFDAAPISVLVAVLVTFGIMAKNNEIVAMKACGVSLHRLALPVFVASLGISAALFAFDHYVVIHANLIQDALRNKIKGRPTQTYLNPERKLIFGRGSRIYYYKYLNETEGVLGGVSVYELDPATFKLRRHIYAERARWEPRLNLWNFQNGWSRVIRERADDDYFDFTGSTATFRELDEPPSWFLKEVKTYKQMNYRQLRDYIAELRQSGFNTIPLQVQYARKFSAPLFALVMALISVPFAFLTGGRGAMTGVGVSFVIAIAYFAMNYLFEQLGNVNLLPPEPAAWSPLALFTMAAIWLMARMRT